MENVFALLSSADNQLQAAARTLDQVNMKGTTDQMQKYPDLVKRLGDLQVITNGHKKDLLLTFIQILEKAHGNLELTINRPGSNRLRIVLSKKHAGKLHSPLLEEFITVHDLISGKYPHLFWPFIAAMEAEVRPWITKYPNQASIEAKLLQECGERLKNLNCE